MSFVEIKCPRNDTRIGVHLDITYPYYETRCDKEGECRRGMILSLDCTEQEAGFRPLFQCDSPADAPTLATRMSELDDITMSGVWFPTPTCSKC